jgi:hypothetical protein
LLQDPEILSPELFDHLLLMQIENWIPLLVFSHDLTRKGAFCSFAADLEVQGRLAAHS